MNYKMTPEVLPRNITSEAKLPDMGGVFEIDKHKKGKSKTIIRIKITSENRQIDGKEMVTTPAGKFECYKITETNTIEAKAFFLKGTDKFKSITWYNPEIGVVKSETYTSKGKLDETMILEKISK